jgi:hypothetical protein
MGIDQNKKGRDSVGGAVRAFEQWITLMAER